MGKPQGSKVEQRTKSRQAQKRRHNTRKRSCYGTTSLGGDVDFIVGQRMDRESIDTAHGKTNKRMYQNSARDTFLSQDSARFLGWSHYAASFAITYCLIVRDGQEISCSKKSIDLD